LSHQSPGRIGGKQKTSKAVKETIVEIFKINKKTPRMNWMELLYLVCLFTSSFTYLFWQYWGLNIGPCPCPAGTLPLEPCSQNFLFLVIFQGESGIFA
jgi:hypothetical protein